MQGCLLDVRVNGAVRMKKFTPLRLLNEGFDFEFVPLILILFFFLFLSDKYAVFVCVLYREHGNVTW